MQTVLVDRKSVTMGDMQFVTFPHRAVDPLEAMMDAVSAEVRQVLVSTVAV
ncbi:MAG: hypothetical protein AB7P76_02955 [Candidatus Melainabacteria bacterium]